MTDTLKTQLAESLDFSMEGPTQYHVENRETSRWLTAERLGRGSNKN